MKKMRLFIDIFDVKKLKESTSYIIEGEKYKHQKELESIKDKISAEMLSKEISLKSLQKEYEVSKKDYRRNEIFYEILFHSENIIFSSMSQLSLLKSFYIEFLNNQQVNNIEGRNELNKSIESFSHFDNLFFDLSKDLTKLCISYSANKKASFDKLFALGTDINKAHSELETKYEALFRYGEKLDIK